MDDFCSNFILNKNANNTNFLVTATLVLILNILFRSSYSLLIRSTVRYSPFFVAFFIDRYGCT